MHKTLAVFVFGLSFALCAAAGAQQLPKTGTIRIHTGWKVTAEVLNVADKQVVGHVAGVGTSFNDEGTGPLHLGAAECVGAFFNTTDGRGKQKGYCAFGDADGDPLYTDWDGTSSPDGDHGTNNIVGGTGKYAGIQGSGPWKCKGVSPNGALRCEQQFDYRLP